MAEQDNSKLITALTVAAAAGLAVMAISRSDKAKEVAGNIKDKASDKLGDSDMGEKAHAGFYETLGLAKGIGKNIEGVELIMDDGSHRMVKVDQLTKEDERRLIGKSMEI